MPTYDYQCGACDYECEVFHEMSAEPLKDCPECGKPEMIKLIGGGAAVIIKGTKTPCRGDQKTKRGNELKKLGSDKTEKPFWRSGKDGKIRKDILKKPEKYIKTGEI